MALSHLAGQPAVEETLGGLEVVHTFTGAMPTGVTVSHTGRVAADGFLYVPANQLYRQDEYRGGADQRRPLYMLFRTPVDAGPVRPR